MAGPLIANRYVLQERIGHGGMGVVFRAWDTRLGRTVALKMLPAEVTHDAELKRRLETEARAASALNHPSVATVYDLAEHEGESFIAFEYVDGKMLRDEGSRGRMKTAAVLDIGIQIADALEAAHKRGIVHRDLKPENILMTTDAQGAPRVKLLDFGLAKILKPLKPVDATAGGSNAETAPLVTAAGIIVGTVNYMSPEQVLGEAADARADIYSLGLVLYELASGVNPFAGKTAAVTMANILKEEAPPMAERGAVAPPELDRIVRKCLRKRREERYQRARELLVDLTNLRHDSERSGSRGSAEAAPIAYDVKRGSMVFERGVARKILLAMQAGYLLMYGLFIFMAGDIGAMNPSAFLLLSERQVQWLWLGLFFTALAGTPVRLYLLTAVSADYPDLGRKFARLFPLALFLDLAWATAPLLLDRRFGALSLVFVGGLAYLPFSQRRLVYDAYSVLGGRTSGRHAKQVEE